MPSASPFTTPTLRSLLWEAPQTLLGLLLWGGLRVLGDVQHVEREGDRWVLQCRVMAVSLGHVVFWTDRSTPQFHHGPWTRDHELGHAVQSRRFGPAYLMVVGFPSVLRLIVAYAVRAATGRRWRGYFAGWPERQADALGGVARPIDPQDGATA